jgi:hypothetical protein
MVGVRAGSKSVADNDEPTVTPLCAKTGVLIRLGILTVRWTFLCHSESVYVAGHELVIQLIVSQVGEDNGVWVDAARSSGNAHRYPTEELFYLPSLRCAKHLTS